MTYKIVVAWHNPEMLKSFLDSWGILTVIPSYLILQRDEHKEGCAVTKNKGIAKALESGAEVVMVLDDDCYPDGMKLEEWAQFHLDALEPAKIKLYDAVTDPPSRGTPYYEHFVKLPVAASMGFWELHPDYDAARTLVDNDYVCKFHRKAMYHRFFPFSGMNCAFKAEFWPYFKFDEEAPRFDDIWMGYRLQQEAYKRGHCINLQGPTVRHVRQSNVWQNLHIESHNLERNETEWKKYI